MGKSIEKFTFLSMIVTYFCLTKVLANIFILGYADDVLHCSQTDIQHSSETIEFYLVKFLFGDPVAILYLI